MSVSAFTSAEYESRVERARALMQARRQDAILLTAERNIEYFAGFLSDLWVSPTRPFFFILPRVGEPVAVVPQGADRQWRRTSWVTSVVTWPSPRPEDEGISTVSQVMSRIGRRFGHVGLEMGPESRIGIPVQDVLRLIEALRPFEIADCSNLCRDVRIIKSAAEIQLHRKVCAAASRAFARLPSLIEPGMNEMQVASRFMAELLLQGADKIPFLAFASGEDGYDNILSRPTDRRLSRGDIVAIDTGATVGGYFCDFDRNLALGRACDDARRAYEILYAATEAGIQAARPGALAADLFIAQMKVIEAHAAKPAAQGRFGHGIGMSLTEWPSNRIGDLTELRPGMVITIEPGVDFGGDKVMVHEENLVITDDGCELLSHRAPNCLPEVPW